MMKIRTIIQIFFYFFDVYKFFMHLLILWLLDYVIEIQVKKGKFIMLLKFIKHNLAFF